MTKKLEELFNIAPTSNESEEVIEPAVISEPEGSSLREKLDEVDKIASALPKVNGLGDVSDSELDSLAAKSEQAYDDIMDLGMNVEPRYSARLFEVAGSMMRNAIDAKTAKIDKKLKMVELQLKKLAIDKKNGTTEEIDGEGFIVTDRNSLLEKLKNLNK